MAQRIFQFGDFAIDLDARTLRRTSGQTVLLPARVFECVAWLIQHRNRAVGRDELIAAIWNRTDPSDNSLVQLILRTRKLLDDSTEDQSTIRTVPGFGYQWVAPTRLLEEPGSAEQGRLVTAAEAVLSSSPPVVQVDAARAPGRRNRFAPFFTLGLGLLIALGTSAYIWRHQIDDAVLGSSPVALAIAPKSELVAVLPFGGSSTSDADWAWLRLGLMDLVATRFSKAGQAVLPSSYVIAIVRDEQVPKDAADKVRAATSARWVLSSTATRSDEGWVVHMDLRDREGSSREAQARAAQVIDAAQQATDQLLDRMGKLDHQRADPRNIPATELLQRAQAAALADRFDEARRLLESAPTELRGSPELRLRLARLDFQAGKLEGAKDSYTVLLRETSAESDPLLRARILDGLGSVYGRSDRFSDAEQSFTEAIGLLSNLNDSAELGTAYFRRGSVQAMHGQYDQARADYAMARITYEKAGDIRALALVNADEGALNVLLRRFAEALQLLQEASGELERFGSPEKLAVVLGNQIAAYLALLQPGAALDVATRAGARFDTLENPFWRDWFKYHKAFALLEAGRLAEGRGLLVQLTKEIRPEEGNLLAMVQALQAEMEYRAGDFEAAATTARQSVTALAGARGRDQSQFSRSRAWFVAARALRALHRNADVDAEILKYRAWGDTTGNLEIQLYVRLAEAEQAWSQGRRDTAIGLYDDLMRDLPRDGVTPANTADIVISYGNQLINEGYMDRAAAVVGQVARFAELDFDCALLQVRFFHRLGERDAWQIALDRARRNAGERMIPTALTVPPQDRAADIK